MDTEPQYTDRQFAHFGNSKNADYSKMIVVCIYMHRFEPFQLKKNGEYDVFKKETRNTVMQCNIGHLWILPGEKYNTTELNFNEGQKKFPEYCVSGGTECAVTRLLKGFQ